MSDKLREVCEAWANHCFTKPSEYRDSRDYADRLANWLKKHGAILPSPVEGKTPGQVLWNSLGHTWWENRGTETQGKYEQAANAVLAAYTPKVAEVEVDACVEQIVRDVLEKSLEDGLIAIGEEFEMAVAYPSHFTAIDLCGPANVLSQHLKNCQERWKASQPQAVEVPEGDMSLLELLNHLLGDRGCGPITPLYPSRWEDVLRDLISLKATPAEPSKSSSVADVIGKIPLAKKLYQHKEDFYRVLGVCYRPILDGGEPMFWVDFQRESDGRIFGCPVAEWIESDYRLVERKAGE